MLCVYACLTHLLLTDHSSHSKQHFGPKGTAVLRSKDNERFSLLLYAPVTKRHDFLQQIGSCPVAVECFFRSAMILIQLFWMIYASPTRDEWIFSFDSNEQKRNPMISSWKDPRS